MRKLAKLDWETLKQLLGFIARRSSEDRIPQIAGSLTFTTVLSMVPLFAVTFALFTAFPIFNSFRDSLQGFLASHLMPESVNSQIFKYLNLFASKAKGLTAAGLIGLLVTSVATMMTIESVFNVIWRVSRPRPLAQRVLVYWSILTLGPLLFGISLSISSYVLSQSMSLVHTLPIGATWLLGWVPLGLTAVGFTLLYTYMPHIKVNWRDAAVGGVAAAVAFELAKRGFAFYIKQFPTYTAVYGAFATVPIFLLWVYLSWLVTLLGATLTAILPALRQGHFYRRQFPGSELLDMLTLLALMNEAREAGRAGVTITEAAGRLQCRLEHALRLLSALEQLEWVGRLVRNGVADRWLLLANPHGICLDTLIRYLVIDCGELSRQLTVRHLDGHRIADLLQHGEWQVSIADILAKSGKGEEAAGDAAIERRVTA